LRRKQSDGKKGGHKTRGRSQRRTEPLLEQPVADLTGNVPCQVCGHLVDAKRMHPHMVRFHGAAFRSKGI
jgi:hypothetical protein